jgi:ABC-type antimicrobial peptide transport system permease subunit
MIPFVVADLIVSFRKTRKAAFVAGGILGSMFYMVYYPYVMYTYNELLLGKLVSPSMIYHTYFELMPQVMQFTLIPSIVMGVIAVLVAYRFSNKILIK